MSSEKPAPFAMLLRRARRDAGLTQEGLAERARLSRRAISELERDRKRTPRRDTVALLADALELSDTARKAFEEAARRSSVPAPGVRANRLPALALRLQSDERRLIGRAREQVQLRLALAEVGGGQGRLVVIAGQAGVGKTALAEALCRESGAQGFLVLVGRSYDLAETPPYGPWIELLAGLPASARPRFQAADLSHLSPDAGFTGQESLRTAVPAALEAAARVRPLVVVLEDLHWADPDSIHLPRVVARTLAELPILLLVTYRDDELGGGHPLYKLLPVLVREAPARRVDLRSLREADTQALVVDRYHLDDPQARRLAHYLQPHAEGNPFFTLEILRTLEADGHLRSTNDAWEIGALDQFRVPPLLRQVIEGRLTQLNADTRHLLALAAVIGQQVPLDLWIAVAATDDDTILPAAEEAMAARLVEALPDGTGIRFGHALIREALYEGMSALQRRRRHRAVGEALAARCGPTDPDAVAYHFERGGDRRAADWLILAGERAQRAYAWLTAAARFETALSFLDNDKDVGRKGWLLIRLAMLRRLEDVRTSVIYFEEAARIAEATGDRALAAVTLFHGGLIRSMAGDVYRGVPELEAGVQALSALAPAERARLRALDRLGDALDGGNGRGELALWSAEVGRFAEARLLAERLIASHRAVAGDEITADSLGDAYYALAWAHAAQGRPHEAYRAFVAARAAFQAIGHRFMYTSALWYEIILVVLPYDADRLAERRRLTVELTQAFEYIRDATSFSVRECLVDLLVLEGNWAEAGALLTALAAHDSTRSYAARLLGPLARACGEAELAWAQVRAIFTEGPNTPLGAVVCYAIGLQRLAATLALDEDDLVTARHWLAAHDRWLEWSGSLVDQAEALLGWASYYRQVGDMVKAKAQASLALARAEDPRRPLCLLAAHRLLGELETATTHWAAAEEHLELALNLADACAAPHERALTLLALAELRQARGDRSTMRSLLEAAEAICEPLGARPALARAQAIASRLEVPPLARIGAPAGLSPREVEVLKLLTAGLTNAAIAARLVVSPRTIDAHLISIYGKLGVSSRSGAVAFAIDHGLR